MQSGRVGCVATLKTFAIEILHQQVYSRIVEILHQQVYSRIGVHARLHV